jgi:hypothetical protein
VAQDRPNGHAGAVAPSYRVRLEALEADAHVPVAEQVEEQPTEHFHEYSSPEELDRIRLLSVTSAGRLRVT